MTQFLRSLYRRCAPLAWLVLPIVGLSGLVGCGGTATCDETAPFQRASQGEPLSVPDDLAKPTGTGKYDIPEAGKDRPARGPCGDLPPLAPERVAATAEEGVPVVAEQDDGPLPTLDTDVPTPVPVVAPGLGPIETSGSIERDIRESVIAWLRAWRDANGAALVSFYSEDFEPPLGDETRDEWASRRATLLEQTGPADVRFDRLDVTETFAGASARFIQEFHDRGRIDAVIKVLDFRVEEGRWRIVRERVIEVL